LDGALVDTSFLIALVKPEEACHAAALAYYKGCIERDIPLYLSTIVISEFSVKQAATDLELRNYVVVPFNVDHAMRAGQLFNAIERDRGDGRQAVKDDVKLIAQCASEQISHLLTADERTLAKYTRRLAAAGLVATKPIILTVGFDVGWFQGGQSSLLET
jgi:predicted nucleic acid-binding protein